MNAPLTLRTGRDDDGEPLLRAAGEIDMSNIDGFREALTAALSDAAGMLTVDLGEVEYLDSTAINVLLSHAEDIRVIAHPLLMPVLRVSGLTQLATVTTATDLRAR